jgi:hypothetical protein
MNNKKIFTTTLESLIVVILFTLFIGCNVIKSDLLLPQLMVLRKALASVGLADNSNTPAISGIDAPTFSPIPENYAAAQSITVNTTTLGAILCYTTDGSTPSCDATPSCSNGTLYSSPVSIATTTTLKALACKAGNLVSAVGTGSYVISMIGTNCQTKSIGVTASTWQLITHSGLPTSGGGINWNEVLTQWAYDCNSDKVLFFPQNGIAMQTWILDLTDHTWTQKIITMPSLRTRYNLVSDPVRNRMLLFGGCTVGCASNINELWEFNPLTDTWTMISNTGITARWGVGLAIDTLRDRLIVFGGGTDLTCSAGANSLEDIWEYSFGTGIWTNLAPTPPPERCSPEFNYDPISDRFIAHGGNQNNGGTVLTDTCIYDPVGNSWSCSTPGSSPIADGAGNIVYSDAHGSLVRWGGADIGGSSTQEFHQLNLLTATYSTLSQSNPPSVRNAQGLIYDRRRNRLLLYGGRSPAFYDMYEMQLNP